MNAEIVNSTKVISTRVTQEYHLKLLKIALENKMSLSDYILFKIGHDIRPGLYEELESTINQKENIITKLNIDNSAYKSKLEAADKEIKQIQQELDKISKNSLEKAKTIKEHITASDIKYNKLKIEYDELIEKNSKESLNITNNYKAEIKKYQEFIKECTNKLNTKESDIKKIISNFKNSQNAINEAIALINTDSNKFLGMSETTAKSITSVLKKGVI